MISAFVGDQIGFTTRLTQAQIDEVNERFRDGKDYVSKESAEPLNGSTKKKKLTMDMFENDISTSPFLFMFRFGQAHEGYWTHHHMKLQLEDLFDCLMVLFPGHDIICFFDQSSGHTAKRKDALNAVVMNVGFGGRTEFMRATSLTEAHFGQLECIRKPGEK